MIKGAEKYNCEIQSKTVLAVKSNVINLSGVHWLAEYNNLPWITYYDTTKKYIGWYILLAILIESIRTNSSNRSCSLLQHYFFDGYTITVISNS